MKNSFLFSAAAILVSVVLLLSCSKDTNEQLPVDPVPITLNADQLSLVNSGNEFAFDIFKSVTEAAQPGENLIISPLSISVALSMTLNGADGQTRDAMIQALRSSGLTPAKINESYKYLSGALLSVDKRVLLTIANSVWTEKNFPAKKEFGDILKEYYNAEANPFDVQDPHAPDAINNWIEDNTNGLIKNMIDNLDYNTVMLLINAIYFKGKWNSQFDPDKTVTETFYKPGGTSNVMMMKQKTDFKAYQGEGFVLAEFPYGQGNFVMDVILPEENDGINNIIRNLTQESFNSLINNMHETEIDLAFPRFKYGYKKTLNEILSDMGMAIAFTESADFSNISDLAVKISKVLHQAFIETNEEGTEAAAVTVVEMELTSMPAGPLVLRLDHPFMYVIRETTTNAVLFMGRVSDPLAG